MILYRYDSAIIRRDQLWFFLLSRTTNCGRGDERLQVLIVLLAVEEQAKLSSAKRYFSGDPHARLDERGHLCTPAGEKQWTTL